MGSRGEVAWQGRRIASTQAGSCDFTQIGMSARTWVTYALLRQEARTVGARFQAQRAVRTAVRAREEQRIMIDKLTTVRRATRQPDRTARHRPARRRRTGPHDLPRPRSLTQAPCRPWPAGSCDWGRIVAWPPRGLPQSPTRLARWWSLASGEAWDAGGPDAKPVALFLVRLDPPNTLALGFRTDSASERSLV